MFMLTYEALNTLRGDSMQKEETSSGYKLRNFLLKTIVIIAIIALLIWLLPKFASYKKNIKKKNNADSNITSQVETKYESNHIELKEVGLKYYSEEKLPKEVGQKNKVTIEQLQKENLISEIKDSNGTSCNKKDSYVEITKLEDEYLLKTNLVFEDKTDYKIYHVGKYDYCEHTLCENTVQEEVEIETKEENKEQENKTENNNKEEDNTENKEAENKNNNEPETVLVLTPFSKWSAYERTSCDTKEVTCAESDQNCLQELKLYKRTEKIGDKKISYTVTYPQLSQTTSKVKKLCNNSNYLEINGNLYYTNGNYGEVLHLNKNTTENWTYNGQTSLSQAPASNINKYYKFAGIDYSSCKESCGDETKYYYDVYTFNHKLNLVTDITCTSITEKSYPVYIVKNNTVSKNETKPIYATACYKTIRTRSIEQN